MIEEARTLLKQGGHAPPFVFLGTLAAVAGSRQAEVAFWALAVVLILLAGARPAAAAPRPTLLASVAALFCLAIGLNNAWLSPSYSAAGIYHPLMLLAGFLSLRALPPDRLPGVFAASSVVAAGSCLWGLWQIARAEPWAIAAFEAPNTLAATSNLFLVPALALLAWKRFSAAAFALAAVLFGGLLATGSLGGKLALLAGITASLATARRVGLGAPRHWRSLAAAAAVGAGLYGAAYLAGHEIHPSSAAPSAAVDELPGAGAPGSPRALPPATAREATLASRQGSPVSRIELYALAWNAAHGHWMLGTGFLTFRYILEQGRESAPSFAAEGLTYFVHNDYLQALLELGAIGLALFLAMVAAPFWVALRPGAAVPAENRLPLAAAIGAIASMAFHALLDFPFNVPICLLVFGGALGVVDQCVAPQISREENRAGSPPRPLLWRTARAAVLALIGYVAALPLAADAAASHGRRQFAAGDAASAAYWLEVARRLQPADWRYHWYLGQFWFAQAAAGGSKDAAHLAMRAFLDGARANSMEPRNLIGAIETGRRLRPLLGDEAAPQALESLSAQALALAPLNPAARRERILALELSGRRGEALALAERWADGTAQGAQFAQLARSLRQKSAP